MALGLIPLPLYGGDTTIFECGHWQPYSMFAFIPPARRNYCLTCKDWKEIMTIVTRRKK